MQYWMQSQKQNDLSSFPRQTIQHHSDPSLCPNHWCGRRWSWPALWRPKRPYRTNTNKKCSIHHRELKCKHRKSRNTWSNRQVWPWITKWSKAKANKILPREHTDHSKHPIPTTQEMTLHVDITKWSILKSDWLCILCSWRWRSSIQSAKIRLWADCGSEHQILIAKFKLKLKKTGKTTRPFRYDLNPIPYDYTVDMMNRFKGLDLVSRVPEELQTEICITVQEALTKTIPKIKKCKKAKRLSEEALQIAEKRREVKSKGERER